MNRNISVGLFLIGGTVVFGTGLFLLGNRQKTFSRHFEVYAEFANVSSLESGADVKVSGLDAGEVLSIQVPAKPSGKFRVKARLDQKDHPLVRTDSRAVILSEGMVGDKYLEIDKGSDNAQEAPDGGTIQSTEPFDISDMIQSAQTLLNNANTAIKSAGRVAQDMDETLGTFLKKGANGANGAENLRATVASAQQTMSNMADDTEALKHNFLLRGFFKKRGYYDLDNISVADYRKSKFVRNNAAKRAWISADRNFATSAKAEELTPSGRKAVDDAMSPFVGDLPASPIVVEGYSSSGTASDRYRVSLERATAVQQYLESKFKLDPHRVGTMPLGATPPDSTGKDTWDGVSIVVLPK